MGSTYAASLNAGLASSLTLLPSSDSLSKALMRSDGNNGVSGCAISDVVPMTSSMAFAEERGRAGTLAGQRFEEMVGVAGFEPATPSSRTRCATRLRYTPKPSFLVGGL